MKRLFSAPRPDATPPQAARIEAACRAVARLEPVLLARVAAMRKEAQLATVKVDVSDQVHELVVEATRFEIENKKVEARKSLEKALELAPDDEAVKRKLGTLTAAIDLAQAAELVKSAEVFVNGVGMKGEAVRRAREAVRLTKHREVRLLAVRVFAKAGESADAILIAEELVDADPRDALAMQALLTLHEKAHDWRAAAKIGEALLRLKGGDVELQKRLKKIVEQIRR
jgi:tetratricopeptide (TPR) repeat protein